MTTSKKQVVNKDLDEFFSDKYGKSEWLTLIGVNKSNWVKMIAGDRKLPNIYKMHMDKEEELIRLKNVVHGISPDTKIEDLMSYLEQKESSELEALKIENDKLKSCVRIITAKHQRDYQATEKLMEKLR